MWCVLVYCPTLWVYSDGEMLHSYRPHLGPMVGMYHQVGASYLGLCGLLFVVHVCDIGGTPCDMQLSLQYGCTPLMVASGRGHVECVKLLLDRGAQTNHQSKVSAVLLISVIAC